jgi:hypothetical protein
MVRLQEHTALYCSSANVPESIVVSGITPGTLGRELAPPEPSAAVDSLRARLIGLTKHPLGYQTGVVNTGSISLCTAFLEQRASRDYDFMVSRVLELLQVEDDQEDDYGAIVPTRTALSNALTILHETFRELQTTFPRAVASVSFDGGIRIQWMRPESSLRLVIPGSDEEEAYIYFEHEDDYGTESVSATNLARRIKWLQRIFRHAEST